MARPPSRGRKVKATRLCRHFDGTILAAHARAGLAVLERDHKAAIIDMGGIACGVALDLCRKDADPDSARWDYIFVRRTNAIPGPAVAIEVHHACATEIDQMIRKKEWAEALIQASCPNVQIDLWIWIASPPQGEVLFTPQHHAARLLAEAGIMFPRRHVEI